MGFLEDAGEFLFGTQTANQAKANTASAADTGRQMAEAAAAQGQAYDQGARQSMGANAGEYLQNANRAAQGMAAEQAGLASRQGAREQIKAMRTAGMNPAASAARAGQQAGRNYAGTFGQGVQSGIGQYMQGTNQFANQGAEMAGRRATGAGIQMGAGQQQKATADATKQGTFNIGQQALGAALSLSDEREKTGIEPEKNDRIAQILAKIDPVRFKYKDEANGSGEQVGVTAQNLEAAGLGGAVEETPDGTKMVDGAKVENFNLDAIKMLSDRVEEIASHLGIRGNK